MAKVKILQSCAGLDFSYYPGEVVEIDDAKAGSFVKHGLAELTENPKPVEKPVEDLKPESKPVSKPKKSKKK